MTCFVVTKTKPILFEWLKNGEKITGTEENVRINTVNEVSTLILDPVTIKDGGNYTCSASNIYGNDKYTSNLEVKGKNFYYGAFFRYATIKTSSEILSKFLSYFGRLNISLMNMVVLDSCKF